MVIRRSSKAAGMPLKPSPRKRSPACGGLPRLRAWIVHTHRGLQTQRRGVKKLLSRLKTKTFASRDSPIERFGTLQSTTSPPTGLLDVGLGEGASPRTIAFQGRIEF